MSVHFDLEDGFLECTGIKPAMTIDEICGDSAEEVDFNLGNKIDRGREGEDSDDSYVNKEEDSDDDNMLKQA